jgi:hypothetical protein
MIVGGAPQVQHLEVGQMSTPLTDAVEARVMGNVKDGVMGGSGWLPSGGNQPPQTVFGLRG